MANRLVLHELFCGFIDITEPDGDRHVYFEQPDSVRMKYPAIRYSRKPVNNVHADNRVYKQDTAYEVTVIDEHPDSEIVKVVSKLPTCKHDRHFKSDNLNHDVFTLYY